MQQLTTKETKIYKNYVFEQIAEKFKEIGSLDIDYLKNLTNIEYEVSDVTNLIYPSIKFYNKFEELQTLFKIELNHNPDDLLEKYKIENVKVPTLHVYKKLDHMNVTPYDTHISPQDCYNTYTTSFSETEVLILTNNEEKEYLFIDKVNNSRLYMLPIDYQKEKSLKIYNNVREIKNQINKIVDKIKPIDAEKLHDLIIKHYKNL